MRVTLIRTYIISLSLESTSELSLDMNESLGISLNHSFCVDLSDWEWKIHYLFRWWLEGVGILLVGTIGVVFNVIAISVLQTKEMVVIRFNNLVVCLAIADTIFLLTSIFYHIGHAFGFQIELSYLHQSMFTSLVYPWRAISMCFSTYITIALALDRYHAVTNPSRYRASLRSATHPLVKVLHCTLPILCLSILFNVSRFFDLCIKEHLDGEVGNSTSQTTIQSYHIAETPLRKNEKYVFWYVNVANFLVTGLVPLALLVYLNGQLILKRNTFIQRQKKRKKSSFHGIEYQKQRLATFKNHRQQTIILHTIVILFLLCHALRIVLNINEWMIVEDYIKAKELGCPSRRFWSSLATPVSHLLLQINSGANFFIYSVLNETFTKVLKEKIVNVLVCFKLLTQRPTKTSEQAVVFRCINTQSKSPHGVRLKTCEIVESTSAHLDRTNGEFIPSEQPV